jgi:hypothetical protein
MSKSKIHKFIDEVKLKGQTCLYTDTQASFGRVVVTALPSIDSEVFHSYRLEYPGDFSIKEVPYPYLFIAAVLGDEAFCEVFPRIGIAMRDFGEFKEIIGDYSLHIFANGNVGVVVIETTPTVDAKPHCA